MSAKHETAYPRFKSDLTDAELDEIYTPTAEEIEFAQTQSGGSAERPSLLIQLKTVPRLGYFVKSFEVPAIIRSHIVKHSQISRASNTMLRELDRSGARHRLRGLVRTRLGIKAFDGGGAEQVERTAPSAAQTL